ncbi:putative O-methyltransferase YrrM [Streptomyces sp. SAI-135]|uniref:O-methyltransferase n=1 Tax=unclassified Streptomyces TaxID=2593676 RepID=UPI002476FB14|nr:MULTISPECIES: O-methyltransferase [unclassified Streptomyces]MDH6519397.1 putative O-methyltransferase YrrM [Streptomyces sp. SAI-090]MDH6551620.1 putative O-methyltransferase YrrM [Streptomyces sp. SAI-041]MDH6570701.1 putative O-methyltransferase YrrM [Streptomyces sp. SAI-117]MDH6616511.1 putative O-methyltransferase YrrM [Streptomyces sp. SAI-135]
MSESQFWDDVDDYFTTHLAPEDEVLRAALRDSEAAGLPSIAVTAPQGKLLQLLAQIQGARTILELGTLGGYSTIWLARALPADGRLVSLEYSPQNAEVARRNIARAGLDKVVEVRVGAALESLPRLADEHPPPFDLVFIDADKGNNPHYVEWAIKLTGPGSLIVVDNVVRGGRVADAGNPALDVQGTRTALELIGRHPRLSATAIQTVGSKGYDGFALARVLP